MKKTWKSKTTALMSTVLILAGLVGGIVGYPIMVAAADEVTSKEETQTDLKVDDIQVLEDESAELDERLKKIEEALVSEQEVNKEQDQQIEELKKQTELLTEENKKQFYISEGFAHGFLVLSDEAEFCYKVTDFYHPGDEGGLAWNDPEIGIEWPELEGDYDGTCEVGNYHLKDGTKLNLSDKDQKWLGLKDTFKF